jgi:hypothetical protein
MGTADAYTDTEAGEQQTKTHSLTEHPFPALIAINDSPHLLGHSIRVDDLELPLDPLLVPRLVLLFYPLVILDRLDGFRFDGADLGWWESVAKGSGASQSGNGWRRAQRTGSGQCEQEWAKVRNEPGGNGPGRNEGGGKNNEL